MAESGGLGESGFEKGLVRLGLGWWRKGDEAFCTELLWRDYRLVEGGVDCAV